MAIIPTRLKKGDTIGIVAPSTPVTKDLKGQLDKGVAFLESLGFHVSLGEHVYAATLGYAASPEEKGDDINRMFANESVRAIICAQGGATANACLSYLNWDVIRANPKIFLGLSDICVLLNAIYQTTGLVTFHGNDVMWGFGKSPMAYDRDEFVACLADGRTGPIPPNSTRKTVRRGRAEGTLLGGNVSALLKLAGTEYFPDFAGGILFAEAIKVRPEHCDSWFRQLMHIGLFDRIAGAIIGFVSGLDDDDQVSIKMEDVLLEVTSGYDFPILKVNDFGHNCPNTALPVGGRVRVDADGRAIEIVEECVA